MESDWCRRYRKKTKSEVAEKKKLCENDRRSTLESLQQTWEENNQFAKIVAAADNAKEKEKNHKAIISNTF